MAQGADWRADPPQLRPTSRTELWVQIRDQIAERVLDGPIPPDEKVWSQEELAEALGISRRDDDPGLRRAPGGRLVVFVKGLGIFSATDEELAAVKKKRAKAKPA
jgi:DNA-binding transcriptional regulator YhcF (GntR family)